MTKKPINFDVVCLMPWVHMHIWPNGNAFPCCMSDSNVVFGNVNENKINDIINNENFKSLRSQMLAGEKPKVCSRCYELEETADTWTLRKNSFQSFKEHLFQLEDTAEDGTINDFKMRYMDIRFSNLCNLKCRTCGPDLSSKWYEDQIVLFPQYDKPKFIDLKNNPTFMNDLQPHLDTIDEVYFAGGEALITPQHYTVLDYWIEKNRTDVRLRYTTNFSSLRYKEKRMLDYWKKFTNVRVAASLDTHNEKAEYARKGTVWKNIINNRKEMLEVCPEVYFEITPTISVFSVYSLFDFHKSWVEQGLLDVNNIRINILTYPRYFSITILPTEYKNQIIKIYDDYIKWLEDVQAKNYTIQSIKGIIDHMLSADHSEMLPDFKKNIEIIDKVREETFISVYPEFEKLWTV